MIFKVRETPKGLQAVEVIKIADADGARFRGLYGEGPGSRARQARELRAADGRGADEQATEG